MNGRLDDAALQALRAAHFPYLAGRIYLDTAAAGLTWQGHGSAVARFYDEVKSRGIDARPEWQCDDAAGARAPRGLARGVARGHHLRLQHHRGAQPRGAQPPVRAGDRIVLAADEFPSLCAACRSQRSAPAQSWCDGHPRAGSTANQALLAALDARSRVLAVSQTHWSTGTTLDLGRLAEALPCATACCWSSTACRRSARCRAIWSQVDVFAASFFKWMLSGFGIGVLVTSPRARAAMEPAYRGYANLTTRTSCSTPM